MDDPYERIFNISGNKDADLLGVRSNDLLATRLKTEVSRIILDALSGSDRSLRTDDGYIKWGLVERRMHRAIDEACS